MAMVDLRRLIRSAALVLVAALSAPPAARAETAIHLTLDRKIDGPSAPFFLAIHKGYFKDEGLDVIIDTAAGGPTDALNRLAAGKTEMAVSDINLLIKSRDANATPIKALFIVFDKPPYAIVARKSHGVVAPRDL